MAYYYERESAYIDMADIEAKSFTSSSLQPTVLFQFVCKSVTEHWFVSPHQSTRTASRHSPSIAEVIRINRTKFLQSPPRVVTQILKDALNHSPCYSRLDLHQIVTVAMTHAQELSLSNPESHKAIYIYCPFIILRQCITNTAVEQEWSQNLMVPAAKTSIEEMLQKVKISESSKDNCTICLEEMVEAVSMPCSHSFHENCIKTWLNTSHSCPLCRFEMPVQSCIV